MFFCVSHHWLQFKAFDNSIPFKQKVQIHANRSYIPCTENLMIRLECLTLPNALVTSSETAIFLTCIFKKQKIYSLCIEETCARQWKIYVTFSYFPFFFTFTTLSASLSAVVPWKSKFVCTFRCGITYCEAIFATGPVNYSAARRTTSLRRKCALMHLILYLSNYRPPVDVISA